MVRELPASSAQRGGSSSTTRSGPKPEFAGCFKTVVDFGASDNPEIFRELAPGEESKYLFFPSVVGAVVPIVNLPGYGEEIAFTPEALAGIYLGEIKKWNDPILVQANRGHRLPNVDILVIHRADRSGTTYSWTDYLSRTSAEWKKQAGTGLSRRSGRLGAERAGTTAWRNL